MKWPTVIIVVGLLMAGCCQSQPPACDPFFGRTTIPPPATGAITGRGADPCYPPSSPGPPQVQLPAQSQSNPCLPMQPSVPAPCPCQPQSPLPSQPMGQSLGAQPPAMIQPTAPPSLAPPPVTTQPASPRAVPSYAAPRPSSTESAGSAAPRPPYPASPPGAGSLSTPSNFPPAAPPAANPAAPPASGNPYAPPDGSFNFRGGSTQQSTPSGTQTADARLGAPTFTSVAVTRSSSAGGPRPVDDPPAEASLLGRQPIVRTLQPRAKDDSSDRSVDIVDLPKNPASVP